MNKNLLTLILIQLFFTLNGQNDGNLDSTFNIGNGFNNDVLAIAVQNDNKILVGGSFTEFDNSNANRIIRLNVDGSRDNSFNIGSGFNGFVSDIIIQSDNKIIIVGFFTTYKGSARNKIVRLNTDGSIDNTFSSVGSNTALIVRDVRIQDDNKILISRVFTTSGGAVINNDIVRLETNGSIDTTFTTGSGTNPSINDFEIDSNGKIYAVGSFNEFDGNNLTMRRIIRLNADGSRDTSFSYGNGFNNHVIDSAIQDDGKIICGGLFSSYSGSVNKDHINRLASNGNDDSFGSNGFPFNNGVVVRTIAIQEDGKVLVGGLFDQYNGDANINIIRLNSNGSRDTDFSTGNGFNDNVRIIKLQADGKILVGGSFTDFSFNSANRLARLNGTEVLSTTEVSANSIEIYPNPVKEIVNVEFDSSFSFKIYSLTGKLIVEGSKSSNQQINVNSLNKGVYILEIETSTNGKLNHKFIKE